jgi:hypothetical protein
MKHARLLFILATFAALAGCPTDTGPTYTVTGMINYDSATAGDLVVTVTDGGSSHSATLAIGGGDASVAYSVSNVPAGTYSVSARYPRASGGYAASYSINGGGSLSATIVEPGGDVIATADNVVVDANLQLDMSFGVL